jgi:hypothetical protein
MVGVDSEENQKATLLAEVQILSKAGAADTMEANVLKAVSLRAECYDREEFGIATVAQRGEMFVDFPDKASGFIDDFGKSLVERRRLE